MADEEGGRGERRDDRVLVARIAAAERWGRTRDRTAATEPARRGLRAKFEREADPDETLSPQERTRRADQLTQAHMLRMSCGGTGPTSDCELARSRTQIVLERVPRQR